MCARDLDRAGVRYALIGGFAMALRGVQRATQHAEARTAEGMQNVDPAPVAVRAEIVRDDGSRFHPHAGGFGRDGSDSRGCRLPAGVSFGKRRAERIAIDAALSLPVVAVEDIIGLKIQALTNDPSRAAGDWHDIALLIEAARMQGRGLDWELIGDYLRLFDLGPKLTELKLIYGAAQ